MNSLDSIVRKAALAGAVIVAAMVLIVYSWQLFNQPSDISMVFGALAILFVVGSTIITLWRIMTFKPHVPTGTFGKDHLPLILLCLFMASGLFAGCAKVKPGYVGIVVHNSGSDKGIETADPGYVWHSPTTDVYDFPTFVQTAKWTKSTDEGKAANEEIAFNSSEGMTITADISLSYRLEASKVKNFFVTFRSDDLDRFTDGYLRNTARDEFNAVASTYTAEQIYGAKKEEFLSSVRDRVNKQVAPIGVTIEQFGFIGVVRLPDQVVQALNAKPTATQQAMQSENELRKSQAEAAKRVAEAEGNAKAAIAKASGEAQANSELAKSITPELLRWKELEIENKWNGVLPVVQSGNGGGTILNIPLPQNK